MPTEAEKLVEIREDVERISRAFWNDEDKSDGMPDWSELHPEEQESFRSTVSRLLLTDVIRVGKRPVAGPAPLEGQLTLVDRVANPDGY